MRLALLATLLGFSAFGQVKIIVNGQCQLPFTFHGAAIKALPDNTGTQCSNWTITYASSGFTGLTLSVQEAPDAGNTPGTWVDWGGTVVSGSQPNTATTQAATQLSGYFRWVRVKLSGLSGTGVVAGMLQGTANTSALLDSTPPTPLLNFRASFFEVTSDNSLATMYTGRTDVLAWVFPVAIIPVKHRTTVIHS